ncbi:unnamed protein product, partial [Amoebophrya sp. A120]
LTSGEIVAAQRYWANHDVATVAQLQPDQLQAAMLQKNLQLHVGSGASSSRKLIGVTSAAKAALQAGHTSLSSSGGFHPAVLRGSCTTAYDGQLPLFGGARHLSASASQTNLLGTRVVLGNNGASGTTSGTLSTSTTGAAHLQPAASSRALLNPSGSSSLFKKVPSPSTHKSAGDTLLMTERGKLDPDCSAWLIRHGVREGLMGAIIQPQLFKNCALEGLKARAEWNAKLAAAGAGNRKGAANTKSASAAIDMANATASSQFNGGSFSGYGMGMAQTSNRPAAHQQDVHGVYTADQYVDDQNNFAPTDHNSINAHQLKNNESEYLKQMWRFYGAGSPENLKRSKPKTSSGGASKTKNKGTSSTTLPSSYSSSLNQDYPSGSDDSIKNPVVVPSGGKKATRLPPGLELEVHVGGVDTCASQEATGSSSKNHSAIMPTGGLQVQDTYETETYPPTTHDEATGATRLSRSSIVSSSTSLHIADHSSSTACSPAENQKFDSNKSCTSSATCTSNTPVAGTSTTPSVTMGAGGVAARLMQPQNRTSSSSLGGAAVPNPW